ncbi:nicotinamide-nucleotide amidohydrolase family protein [Arsenophonus symbiont of Ornithomya chloropus]|uniref:nicotinamide-nucleotide amidohydrolase family protein n=1 Tax=Arsenophonus symbiont of Ornithomya chloropus TaxID=634121 RepID=UPI0032B12016
MNTEQLFYKLSKDLGDNLKKTRKIITLVESCTGGWISKVITDVAGSSSYFQKAFITYSDKAKHDILGIDQTILSKYGAVSEQVVIDMAKKALILANADFALAVSGIAGPNGATDLQPIGTVWFAFSSKNFLNNQVMTYCCYFEGNRLQIRRQAVIFSLETLIKEIKKQFDI